MKSSSRSVSCDAVIARVAVGEPLGELTEHVADCAECQRVVDLPNRLAEVHQEADPGLGFTARMTIGAQHRLAVRRRRRVAVGFGATVAVAVAGVVFVTHTPRAPSPLIGATPPAPAVEQPLPVVTDPTSDEDLKALVRFADVDRSSRVSARWRDITKPLAPYRKLVKGVKP
ncbi:MAG: hypothetical protein AB7O24_01005 [Kofleriaceae bacterium]